MTVPLLLVISPRDPLPEPLPGLMARGEVEIHRLLNIYETASAIVSSPRPYAGILADSDWLSLRELNMLTLIQRHTALPIWTLPALNYPKPVNDLGLQTWETALQDFAERLHFVFTLDLGRSNKNSIFPSKSPVHTPDNPPEKLPEIPLASSLAPRYDALDAPVLSRSEIAALLGTDE